MNLAFVVVSTLLQTSDPALHYSDEPVSRFEPFEAAALVDSLKVLAKTKQFGSRSSNSRSLRVLESRCFATSDGFEYEMSVAFEATTTQVRSAGFNTSRVSTCTGSTVGYYMPPGIISVILNMPINEYIPIVDLRPFKTRAFLTQDVQVTFAAANYVWPAAAAEFYVLKIPTGDLSNLKRIGKFNCVMITPEFADDLFSLDLSFCNSKYFEALLYAKVGERAIFYGNPKRGFYKF